MNKIFNIILIIILFSLTLAVYFNIDSIISYSKKFFEADKSITLKEPNEYKKEYDIEKYDNYTTKEDYVPANKEDLEEIIYNVLNNGWKNFTFFCPDNYTTCQSDVETLSNDRTTLSAISNYVNPFNSYENISVKIYIDGKVEILVDKNYTDEEINIVNEELNNIEKKLNLLDLNKKGKITAIHDYVLKNSKYDKERSENGTSNYSSNKAIGPLKQGYSICSGYSDTLALFLDRYNIPNFKIANDKHVWNYVYIDGKWYHVDLTWDLPNEANSEISDTFLLITTKELKSLDTTEHSINTEFYTLVK